MINLDKTSRITFDFAAGASVTNWAKLQGVMGVNGLIFPSTWTAGGVQVGFDVADNFPQLSVTQNVSNSPVVAPVETDPNVTAPSAVYPLYSGGSRILFPAVPGRAYDLNPINRVGYAYRWIRLVSLDPTLVAYNQTNAVSVIGFCSYYPA